MPVLPAICDTCLTVWTPNAINLSNASNIHLSDVAVSPCPNCGGVGHIPDGIYSATTDTISVIATSARSVQSLAVLARVLKRARDQRADAGQLALLLEQEKAADLKPVADVVRRLPRKLDVKYWVGITLAVIAILQAQATDRKTDNIASQVAHIYAQVVGPAPTATPAPVPVSNAPPATASSAYPKVGRNQPCPCGSGRKYKYCHGA